MKKVLILMIVCALVSAQDTAKLGCHCTDGQTVCLSDAQVAERAKHVEMMPDRMGDHSNGSGIVVLEVEFDKNGKVINAKAVSGHPIAIHLLISAVPKWRFRPVVQNGALKQGCGRLTLRYKIIENQTSVTVEKPQVG